MTARLPIERAALLGLSLLAAASCTVTVEREGDGSFLRPEMDWRNGLTTTGEVLEVLGPPDVVTLQGDELWFVYRHRDIRGSLFSLKAYGLSFFTRRTMDRIDTTLFVAFDEADRLLFHGSSEGPLDRKLLFLDY